MSGYPTVNVNNNVIDDFLDIFKKFYNSVKSKLTKNDEMTLDEFLSKYSDDKEFLNYLDSVKLSLNEISDLMEQMEFKYDEYYNFISIKKMIIYIVNNLEKYFYYSSFILILLKNFNDLMIKEKQLESYKEEYEKFDSFYMKKKISFTLKFLIPIQNTTMQ